MSTASNAYNSFTSLGYINVDAKIDQRLVTVLNRGMISLEAKAAYEVRNAR